MSSHTQYFIFSINTIVSKDMIKLFVLILNSTYITIVTSSSGKMGVDQTNEQSQTVD